MPRERDNRTDEVVGVVLLGLGTALFLALISYTPKDVPTWFRLLNSTSSPNSPAQNFIGPIGAIIAGCAYFLLGGAAYLLAAVLLGYGGVKVVTPGHPIGARALWIAGFLFSATCLLALQDRFLLDWREQLNIPGAGGWLGYWVGARLLQNLLGKIGSIILLSCLYVASLVLMTGIRPLLLVRRTIMLPAVWWEKYHEFRKSRAATERERLEIEEKELARKTRKLERTLSKKGVAPLSVPASASDEADELFDRPEPKIIDTAIAKTSLRSKDRTKLVAKEPVHFDNYVLPELALLDPPDLDSRKAADPDELRGIQATLIETLAQFGISVDAGDITKGPTITRYEVYPAKGVRVDKIVSLERDLARATRAERINILAPIPGKDTVGIEIANRSKIKVTLREIIDSEDWHNTKARIPIALGKDVYGKTIIADLAQMPHGLVAGTTGSGKSVCINAIIASILFRFSPDDLRFIMIDPKVVEMQIYNTLPHLVIPVVTDPKKVLLALRWIIDEMEKRYKIFAKTGVRNITVFNARPKPKSQKELDAERVESSASVPLASEEDEQAGSLLHKSAVEEYVEHIEKIAVPRDDDLIIPERMPYIIVIIDELADLMQTAPADVESAIARITQMARAAGIHMIVATQTPRADIVTGVIKANIPCRIAFQVASKIDSRVILDENGAERLLGQGDMLYLPPGSSRLIRSQGVLVTEEEIRRLVDYVSSQSSPAFEAEIHDKLQSTATPEEEVTDEDEELVQKCIEIMRQEKKASTSLFQRRLRLGYTRAARVVDILEQRGYVAPGEGAKPREILKDLDALA
jgi:DNA segregation ATPase FtsK/SpoIIIE, S-DNA-T family